MNELIDKLKNTILLIQEKGKIGLVLSVAALSIVMIVCLLWLSRAQYTLVFNHLSAAELTRTVGELESMGVKHKLSRDGQSVLVEKSSVNAVRMKLMAKNIQLNNSVGFELFDKNDFGMTEFNQSINLQRALQGELERTINTFDEVVHARVHLTIPKKELFEQQGATPKASVVLTLSHALKKSQVMAVKQLVASSIDKLTTKSVFVTDSHGRLLTGQDKVDDAAVVFKDLKYKQKLEHYLQEKAQQQLFSLFNDENALVNIDLVLDESLREQRIEKPWSKNNNGYLQHKKTHQHQTQVKPDAKGALTDKDTEENYIYGKEVVNVRHLAGKIKRLTISVVVPKITNAKRLELIKMTVANAVGFDKARGDAITVAAINELDSPIGNQPSKIEHVVLASPAKKTLFPPLIKQGYLAILLMVMSAIGLFIAFKPRRKLSDHELDELAKELLSFVKSKESNSG